MNSISNFSSHQVHCYGVSGSRHYSTPTRFSDHLSTDSISKHLKFRTTVHNCLSSHTRKNTWFDSTPKERKKKTKKEQSRNIETKRSKTRQYEKIEKHNYSRLSTMNAISNFSRHWSCVSHYSAIMLLPKRFVSPNSNSSPLEVPYYCFTIAWTLTRERKQDLIHTLKNGESERNRSISSKTRQ